MWGVRSWYAHHEVLWWLVLLSVASLLMGVFARSARFGTGIECFAAAVARLTPANSHSGEGSYPVSWAGGTRRCGHEQLRYPVVARMLARAKAAREWPSCAAGSEQTGKKKMASAMVRIAEARG